MATRDVDTPVYSIGSVARMLSVSVQTIRMYEVEGLIIPHKSSGGHRLYSQADLERLECIRRAINEEKISIAGIRRMQSLIPCWQVAGCPQSQRSTCPAFTDHDGGCWTYRHTGDACTGRDCRECAVYRSSTNCADIKRLIHSTVDRAHAEQAGS